MDGGGLASEFVDGFDKSAIDFAMQGVVDNLDRFGGGDAKSSNEFGFEAGLLHGGRDCLPSPVHDHGFDAGEFQENDIAHDVSNEFRIVHGRTTHFDQEGFATKALEVGEGLDEHGGFLGGIRHGRSIINAPRLDHREYGLMKRFMKRVVRPELLDSLPGDHPDALRSRRDLRLINFLMRNERWILRQIEGGTIVELGAGSGVLTRQLAAIGKVTGLDLQEKPEGLDCGWKAGDLFETFAGSEGDVVVANLILHHFEDDDLEKLGKLIRSRRRFVSVEPLRSRLSLVEGALLWPLLNRVTRHDMNLSIRAGFRKGELRELLKLGREWEWREEVSLLGGLRVLAWRR